MANELRVPAVKESPVRSPARTRHLKLPNSIVFSENSFNKYVTGLKTRIDVHRYVKFLFDSMELYNVSRTAPFAGEGNFVRDELARVLGAKPELCLTALQHIKSMTNPKMSMSDRWAGMVSLSAVPAKAVAEFKDRDILFKRLAFIFKHDLRPLMLEASIYASLQLRGILPKDIKDEILAAISKNRKLYVLTSHPHSSMGDVIRQADRLTDKFANG